MKLQFPHFSHRIPARLLFSLEMTLLWGGLAALIAVNVFFIQKGRPAYWNKLMMLFEAPFSVSRYIDLASLLWQQGDKKEAHQLMISAQTLVKTQQTAVQGRTNNVLGQATSPADTLSQWEHEVDQLKKRYTYWQAVAMDKPDYRDAFVTLAALAYQLGNVDDARIWLTKAYTLDPNSTTIQEFLNHLR